MPLKDRIAADVDRVFMQTDHFCEKHYWNGRDIACILDDMEALKRKNNNVNDISWDNNSREMLIHAPASAFPAGDPEPNTHIFFDRKPMKVLSVGSAMGILHISLLALDPREMM